MQGAPTYLKVVEWSDEDRCFVGSAPGLLYGGCHGDDEAAVRKELDRIVAEAISLGGHDGRAIRRD